MQGDVLEETISFIRPTDRNYEKKCGQTTLPLECGWGLPIFSLVTPSALPDTFFPN